MNSIKTFSVEPKAIPINMVTELYEKYAKNIAYNYGQN